MYMLWSYKHLYFAMHFVFTNAVLIVSVFYLRYLQCLFLVQILFIL